MVNQDTEKASKLAINIWTNLDTKEKQEIKNRAMVYFPEVFSNRGDKFARLAIWLIMREAIVCSNIRDLFIAGGRGDYSIKNTVYKDIPRVFLKLFTNIDSVLEILNDTSSMELSDYWNTKTREEKRSWIGLIWFQCIRKPFKEAITWI